MVDWPYVTCDVFTDRPLVGNQLAVFLDATPISEALLQPLAREINFAETVFVFPPTRGGDARLRIFTTVAELPFAGHPVLGTAIVLALSRNQNEITIETGVGPIPVRVERRGSQTAFGRMEQPIPTFSLYPDPAAICAALGVDGSELPIERYDNGPTHLFLTLNDEAAVARLAPDLGALARAADAGPALVSVNCFAGRGTSWKTRMFAPHERCEDAATGSAAGPLACHLARHGRIPWGTEIEIFQGTEIMRPSRLFARASGSSAGIEAVEVSGHAVVVGRGAFDGDVLAAVLAPPA